MHRREFVASTGVAGVSLVAGCLGSEEPPEATEAPDTEGQSTVPEDTLATEVPEDVERLLESLPAAVGGESLPTLTVFDLLADPKPASPVPETGLEGELGVGMLAFDRGALASYGSAGRSVRLILGSFDSQRVEQPSTTVSVQIGDGFVAFGTDGFSPYEAGVDAVVAARDGSATVVRSEGLERALAPLADHTLVEMGLTPERASTQTARGIERAGYGIRAVSRGRIELNTLVQFGSASATSRGPVVELFREIDRKSTSRLSGTRSTSAESSPNSSRTPHRSICRTIRRTCRSVSRRTGR